MFIFQQLANVSWSYLVRTGDTLKYIFCILIIDLLTVKHTCLGLFRTGYSNKCVIDKKT